MIFYFFILAAKVNRQLSNDGTVVQYSPDTTNTQAHLGQQLQVTTAQVFILYGSAHSHSLLS
jgi:hypothetical protein